MAKYLAIIGNAQQEVSGLTTSSGAGDAGKIPQLDSSGRLDASLMPSGIGADTEVMATSENLSAGDLVNIWSDAGTRKARKADASNSRRAHGFVLASSTTPNNATVYFSGDITGLTGLTTGNAMFLSGSTAGASTATAPTTAGHLWQEIGSAGSTTMIVFRPMTPIVLA